MRPGERRTTGARVNPMDICNLSFIRHWWQAGPKYGTVNTNHRSFTDADTHRQAPTHINTHPCACTYLKCIFEDRCFYAFTELDTGHTTTCFLQRGVDIFFFLSPYSALSLSLFWERSSPSPAFTSPCWFLICFVMCKEQDFVSLEQLLLPSLWKSEYNPTDFWP